MEIEVRHIDRVNLEVEPFKKVVKKYVRTDKEILIVFDKRITSFGVHQYDSKTKKHIIRISPDKVARPAGYCHNCSDSFSDPSAIKYNVISTLVHELGHINQFEELGWQTYLSHKFSCQRDIKNSDWADYYSPAEQDARRYEHKHSLQAVEYYNECAK